MSLVGLLLLFTLSLSSCGNKNKASEMTKETVATIQAPQFDADSAYQYVKEQVDFGPRVPNSKGHVACGNYLAGQLATLSVLISRKIKSASPSLHTGIPVPGQTMIRIKRTTIRQS